MEKAIIRPRVVAITTNPATPRQNSKHFEHVYVQRKSNANEPTKHARNVVICNAKKDASSSNESEDEVWQAAAFPQYMQPNPAGSEFCGILEEAKQKQGITRSGQEHSVENSTLWRTVIRETGEEAKLEPLLSSSLYASILSHDTFEHSLAFVLANRLSDTTLLSTELFELFYSILKGTPGVAEAAVADLCAVRERDPACTTYAQALLYYKGYHAIQAHRIAHELWRKDRKVMALALQSRSSEVFGVDIHPAAKIGRGVLLDHGTGVVIGETAEIGNNVSILQNVTLGGTGKTHGDRHPKISDNVLIGASATILGSIRIGKGAQVAAGSLVLKPVPPRTMVAGTPAREVGLVLGNPAEKMDQWGEVASPSVDSLDDILLPTDVEEEMQREKAKIKAAKRGRTSTSGGGVNGTAVYTSNSTPSASAVSDATVAKAESSSPADGAAVVEEEVIKEVVAEAVIKESEQQKKEEIEKVEAVTDDEEAKKKWGEKGEGGETGVEYII